MIIKSDQDGKTVKIDPQTSLIRVDNVTVCKRVIRCGRVWLQFKDKDRLRSQCRGTEFIEVPLDMFQSALIGSDIIWPY